MKSADFKKIVSRTIGSRLRELGWKGSGFHYKRVRNGSPLVDVIGFQVNKYGGTFCVEIGVHLTYLKEYWVGQYDLKRLTHASLDIRQRLAPNDEFDFWWKIGINESSTLKTLDEFWKIYTDKATSYFEYFSKFPQPFNHVTINQGVPSYPPGFNKYVRGMTETRLCWLLAQTFDFTKDKDKASQFAKLGLERIKGRAGSALIEDLEEIINKNAV